MQLVTATRPHRAARRFRNYAVRDEKIAFQKVDAAQPPEFEAVEVDPDAVLGADTEVRSRGRRPAGSLVAGRGRGGAGPALRACGRGGQRGREPPAARRLCTACPQRLSGPSSHPPLNPLPSLHWLAEQEVLVNVAPKKANWDLRRDIAGKLARLERRTQSAMIKLMQQEEQRRLEEEGGQAD